MRDPLRSWCLQHKSTFLSYPKPFIIGLAASLSGTEQLKSKLRTELALLFHSEPESTPDGILTLEEIAHEDFIDDGYVSLQLKIGRPKRPSGYQGDAQSLEEAGSDQVDIDTLRRADNALFNTIRAARQERPKLVTVARQRRNLDQADTQDSGQRGERLPQAFAIDGNPVALESRLRRIDGGIGEIG